MNVDTQEVSRENMEVDTETISETTFLLTELRYTLGQLHVQLGDLDDEARAGAQCGGRSLAELLDEMVATEDKYQDRYARLLGISIPEEGGDEQFRGHAAFERKRAQTVALLEQAGESWPLELIDLVKEQIAGDRKYTTEIAECRKRIFETDQRPDLNESLTAAQ